MKVSELTGAALDWAVAKCEWVQWTFETATTDEIVRDCHYSTDWAQGGPIIEREGITVGQRFAPKFLPKNAPPVVDWTAQYFQAPHSALDVHRHYGPTPLIAAMRCLVAFKMGDDVKIPAELK